MVEFRNCDYMKSSDHVGLHTDSLQKRVIQERITEGRNRVGKDVDLLFHKSETRTLVGDDCNLKSSVFMSKRKGGKENRPFSVQLM